MREDPLVTVDDALGSGVTDDNVVALPNLLSGRLADLLAAASGPAQDHELRGELEARTAFRGASVAWPTARRRFRRTPAVLAVTTVATMMVATTGLAAASQLPGPAGRAVQGLLGSVGVTIALPAPSGSTTGASATGASATGASAAGASVSAAPDSGVSTPAVTHSVRNTHIGCVSGSTASGVTTGGIQTASCTKSVAQGATPVVRTAAPSTAPHAPVRTPAAPVVHGPRVRRTRVVSPVVAPSE